MSDEIEIPISIEINLNGLLNYQIDKIESLVHELELLRVEYAQVEDGKVVIP